jgi:hypothetical protein
MLKKNKIEEILSADLKFLLNNKIVYHFSNFEIALNEIILKQSLKFSNPELFNDPFDCNENLLKVSITEKSIKEAFKQIPNNFSPEIKMELIKQLMDPKIISETLKKKKKNYKISCFSKICTEVLMWSHYADKHNGICVGFDFRHRYGEKFILCPIRYLDEIKSLDGETDVNRIIMYWLTTKSRRWAYEEEIRAIAISTETEDVEFINYEPKYIKEIIFGSNVSQQKIDSTILKIKESRISNSNILYKRMKIDTETFLLKEEIIIPR